MGALTSACPSYSESMAKHLEEELDAATAGFFMSDRAAPEPKLTSKEEDSEEALLETSDTSPNDVNQLSVYLEACETLDVTPNSQIIQLFSQHEHFPRKTYNFEHNIIGDRGLEAVLRAIDLDTARVWILATITSPTMVLRHSFQY